jgi:hypothetical protein
MFIAKPSLLEKMNLDLAMGLWSGLMRQAKLWHLEEAKILLAILILEVR